MPGYALAFVLGLLCLPFALPVAVAFDVATRRRLATCRFVLLAVGYLGCECLGLGASFVLWLRAGPWRGGTPERFTDANFRLQVRWARALFGLVRTCYGLRVEAELADPGEQRLLVFVRHASLVDTLLPTVFVSGRSGTRLRFVMKRELLLDPCLDVVGQRLPNAFVSRGAGSAEAEAESICRLALDLGPGEGVVLFPEGTRFSEAKRSGALERVRRSGDAARLARVSGLRNVLPPRSRGALALLAAAPRADVLFLGHHGIESAGDMRGLLRGGLIGRRVRVRSWIVPSAQIPVDPHARLAWLDAEWGRLDRWIDAAEEPFPGAGLG